MDTLENNSTCRKKRDMTAHGTMYLYEAKLNTTDRLYSSSDRKKEGIPPIGSLSFRR
jgi:hypothetical protein